MVTLRDRLTGVQELMDQEVPDPEELEGALKDLAWINTYLGGWRVIRKELLPILKEFPAPVRILDVGTGYADLPRAVVRWARRRKLAVEFECLDRSRQILELAIRASSIYPELRFQEGEAGALPYGDGEFDVVLTSLTLHHLEGEDLLSALREMYRVARRAVLVSELQRGPWSYHLTRICLGLISSNRLIRYDGPISVQRAFRVEELKALAESANWKKIRLSRYPFIRLALVGEK